jgi:hypothetical protein
LEKGSEIADVARQYQADLLGQCSDGLNDLYIFVSRALLKCELTFVSRTTRLRDLGFDMLIQPRPLTLNRIMSLFGLISGRFHFCLTFLQEWAQVLFRGASPSSQASQGSPTCSPAPS